MDELLVSIIVLALVAVMFIGLGYPLKLDRVTPNQWYGFRTPKTLADPKIWYEVNRAGGEDMVRAGWLLLTACLLVLAFRNSIPSEAAIAVLLIVLFASIAFMLIRALSILRRL